MRTAGIARTALMTMTAVVFAWLCVAAITDGAAQWATQEDMSKLEVEVANQRAKLEGLQGDFVPL